MSQSMVIDVLRDAFTTILMAAGPVIGIALAVGLIISILQATTQVQEQTLTFVPKMLAVFISIIVLGPFMLSVLRDFTIRMFENIAHVVG